MRGKDQGCTCPQMSGSMKRTVTAAKSQCEPVSKLAESESQHATTGAPDRSAEVRFVSLPPVRTIDGLTNACFVISGHFTCSFAAAGGAVRILHSSCIAMQHTRTRVSTAS